MQVSISHSTLLSYPSAQSLSLSLPFLSFSVILRGSADSGGMIEEGLLERRGKWSANGTLSPIGHLLTLHSPAAHSVGVCVCERVYEPYPHPYVPFLNQCTPLSFPCNFLSPQPFQSNSFFFFTFQILFVFLTTSIFNCHLSWVQKSISV